jgi:hypothetical protein
MPATTVAAYLKSLPADRRAALTAVRDTINANLPAGFEEGILYNSIGWYVPTSRLEKTYNGQPFALACLANQKNYMALYLMSVYGDTKLRTWFTSAFAEAGKKLDMGKACVRFKTLDALPLDVIGQAIGKVSLEQWIGVHEAAHSKTAVAARRATRAKTTKPKGRAKPAKPKRRR